MLEFELLHLKQIKDLITHLSAYNLTIESNTAFAKKNISKNAPNLMKFFIKQLLELDFFNMKSVIFQNQSPNCKHNLAYWQGKNYLACGLSAVGFYENKRFYTAKI